MALHRSSIALAALACVALIYYGVHNNKIAASYRLAPRDCGGNGRRAVLHETVLRDGRGGLRTTTREGDCGLAFRGAGDPAPLSVASVLARTTSRPTGRVAVDTSERYQKIDGFGGAFTEAAATTYAKLPLAEQERFIEL